jgi:hypothetical protein
VGPSLTRPFNLTGYPALSICNGFTGAGLPTSPRIGGRPVDRAHRPGGDGGDAKTQTRLSFRASLTLRERDAKTAEASLD